MTSRHYKWQTRWVINATQRTCTHQPTGLVVRMDRPPVLINISDVAAALMPVHGHHNVPRMLTRLAWEALTLWYELRAIPHMPYEIDELAEAAAGLFDE